ncbi:hypothetical protein FGG08_005940 [Glutinoglossum americanum]|uniref:Prenyltransferase alpha-alpha toroid domain-containing protein n=1 Tax=Glutinoglossum americanum TaxID=1670608 RepID=A0A9P8KVH8_9PEZI|nr:hypothetical protein FGG08_005940 [Glutinoglossum americanum]
MSGAENILERAEAISRQPTTVETPGITIYTHDKRVQLSSRDTVRTRRGGSQSTSPSERLRELLSNNTNSEQHNIKSTSSKNFEDAEEDNLLFSSNHTMQPSDDPFVPKLFTSLPALRDLLKTDSSDVQDITIQECLPFLAGSKGKGKSTFDFNTRGVPNLDRKAHIAFLHSSLGELPAGFVGVDASRPWMLYWALAGLYLLGEDISAYRGR